MPAALILAVLPALSPVARGGEDEGPGDADARKEAAAAKAAKGSKPGKESKPVRPGFDLVNKAGLELLELQDRIRGVEVGILERRKVAAARLRDLETEKSALERTVESLKSRVAAIEKEGAGKAAVLSQKEKEIEKLRAMSTSLAEPMEGFLRRQIGAIEAGIPWKAEERKRAYAAVLEILKPSGRGPAAALAAIGRLQEEEEASSRLIETGTIPVELPSGPIAVPAFRLGLLAVVYTAPDGTAAGFARPGQKLEEGLLETRNDPTIAAGYLQAIDIIRRKAPPRIVDIHVPALPRESEESK